MNKLCCANTILSLLCCLSSSAMASTPATSIPKTGFWGLSPYIGVNLGFSHTKTGGSDSFSNQSLVVAGSPSETRALNLGGKKNASFFGLTVGGQYMICNTYFLGAQFLYEYNVSNKIKKDESFTKPYTFITAKLKVNKEMSLNHTMGLMARVGMHFMEKTFSPYVGLGWVVSRVNLKADTTASAPASFNVKGSSDQKYWMNGMRLAVGCDFKVPTMPVKLNAQVSYDLYQAKKINAEAKAAGMYETHLSSSIKPRVLKIGVGAVYSF